MIRFIKNIDKVYDDMSLDITFNNNETKHLELKDIIDKYAIRSELFRELQNIENFKKVKLDSYGTLSWDNEVEFCPDVLYDWSD